MKPQAVIFIGHSGSGKGTQAKLLHEFLKSEDPTVPTVYIETGARFRELVQGSGYTWQHVKERTEKGRRFPDFLAAWLWGGTLINEYHGTEHIIIDGAPRSLPEAKILDTAITFYEIEKPTVVFLDVTRKLAEERLRGRGRIDDINPESIARRLGWFEEDVVPAIEYYRNNPAYRFLQIDGSQTPEEVLRDLKEGMGLNK